MAISLHLVVFIHGLWGNPEHLKHLYQAIRDKYSEEALHIFAVKSNAGNFTYDGIEKGGERAVREVEEELELLSNAGKNVAKISVIGYSLGGLIARYAIGILHKEGIFDNRTPVNFTTFATPHLGVRAPRLGFGGQIWNSIGAQTLSESGRQMFLVDKFRDTGRPLLAVLADPRSIFVEALRRFKNRTLYANCVNDRTVPYFTAAIDTKDPYVKSDAVDIDYKEGWSPVIVDRATPAGSGSGAKMQQHDIMARLTDSGRRLAKAAPLYFFFIFLLPIGASAYLANSVVQNFRSRRRIKDHEEGRAGHDFGLYKIPLMLAEAHEAAGEMYEQASNSQEPHYLNGVSKSKEGSDEESLGSDPKIAAVSEDTFPTLALTEDQLAMVDSLNRVGWRKHPVYIHKVNHTHAAIIVRPTKFPQDFSEGELVLKHWLTEFEI